MTCTGCVLKSFMMLERMKKRAKVINEKEMNDGLGSRAYSTRLYTDFTQ